MPELALNRTRALGRNALLIGRKFFVKCAIQVIPLTEAGNSPRYHSRLTDGVSQRGIGTPIATHGKYLNSRTSAFGSAKSTPVVRPVRKARELN